MLQIGARGTVLASCWATVFQNGTLVAEKTFRIMHYLKK
jgi:hypothetical protein